MVYKQTKSKYWWISFTDGHGRMRRKSTKTTSKKLAKDIEAAYRTAVAKEENLGIIPQVDPTFRELCDKYWEMKACRLASRGIESMLKQWKNHFGDIRVSKMRLSHVEQYFDAMEKAPSSVNRHKGQFKAMFNWAVRFFDEDRVLTTNNPAKGLQKVPERSRWRYLDRGEMQALLCELEKRHNQHIRPIVLTALYTGMRRGEILNLRWKDVDLKQGIIHVMESKTGRSRTIPITKDLRQIFPKMKSRFKGTYVFVTTRKKGGKIKEFKTAWGNALTRAGIDDFTFHDVRHTFASHLVMRGAGISTVASLLGHADVRMTQRYAHLAPGHRSREIERLDGLTDFSDQEIEKDGTGNSGAF